MQQQLVALFLCSSLCKSLHTKADPSIMKDGQVVDCLGNTLRPCKLYNSYQKLVRKWMRQNWLKVMSGTTFQNNKSVGFSAGEHILTTESQMSLLQI